MLYGLLQPTDELKELQDESNFSKLMVVQEEMKTIARLIAELIEHGEDAVPAAKEEVLALCERFPLYPDLA